MANLKHVIDKDLDDIDHCNYYWFKDGFSSEEIDKIHKIADKYNYKAGTTFDGDTTKIRKSKVKWINYTNESKWLYEKIFNLTKIANKSCYHFNLHYMEDALQYTLYNGGSGDKYDWHLDMGVGNPALRKISGVLLLSDPDEFEGGELQIFNSNEPKTVPLVKGSIVFFPSFFLHRVTEVTKGIRKTLVFWIGGDHYR